MDISKFRKLKDYSDEQGWAEWLNDESSTTNQSSSEPTRSAQYVSGGSRRRVPQSKNTKHSADSESISINIHMPRIRRATLRKAWQHSWPWLVGVIGIVGVLYGGNYLLAYLQERNTTGSELLPTDTRAAVDLGYKPIVPDVSDRPTDAPMPSEPVYYTEQKVYSFTDNYRGVNITVDQQALPDNFRDNDTAILNVAQSINATDDFSTTLGKVYIFTAPTSGAQRLVLANDKMLMFLQSTRSLETSDWVSYIQTLR